MKRGYISKVDSAKEFQKQIELYQQCGVSLDNVAINVDFDAFISSVSCGDTVTVISYIGIFPSLDSYLKMATELIERNIVIESLQEPDIVVNKHNSVFVSQLNVLNHRLRSTTSIKCINKLKDEGRKVGRPAGSSNESLKKVSQVEKLLKESNMSVVNACKITGCNLKTYYRLKSSNTANVWTQQV